MDFLPPPTATPLNHHHKPTHTPSPLPHTHTHAHTCPQPPMHAHNTNGAEKRRKGAAGGTDGSDGGGDGTPRQKSKKNKEAGTPKRKRGSTGQLKGLRADLDLPVDPNEPTYCYCNRVYFGEMIACDNPDCIIEWFHFECVGLTTEQRPKGKWYCPDCTARMQGLGIAQVRK
eukprot:jgi/Mesvir1/20876/Mv07955-RA.2